LCGGGLTNYGATLLRDLGLELAIAHVSLGKMYVRFQNLSWTLWGDPIFRVTRRDELDAWLADEVRARGVALHEGQPVIDVQRQGDGVAVVTDKASYHARVLVAADGSKGVTRRKLGIEDISGVARLLEVLTPEDPTTLPEFGQDSPAARPFAVFDFSPMVHNVQGYYWDFPCYVQGKAHMNRGIYDARIQTNTPRAALKSSLETMLADRDVDADGCEVMGHPIRWFDPRSVFSIPHVLWVGDAAGADPLMGEGIAYALAYGHVAASAISDAFSTNDFRFADYRDRILAHPLGASLRRRARIANWLYRIHSAPMLRLIWRVGRIVMARRLGYVSPAAQYQFQRPQPLAKRDMPTNC
jgi:flavin-dependent dehydrogenase